MFRTAPSTGRVLNLLVVLTAALGIASPSRAAEEDEANEIIKRFSEIEWIVGPGTGVLGNATINVPAGFRFCGAEGAQAFAEFTQNNYNGELGVMMPIPKPDGEMDWFILFAFQNSGYVKDDDKDKLDDELADNLLENYKKGTEAGNAALESRGWATLSIKGWHQKPFYDEVTKNLTWAMIIGDSTGGESVNYDSKVLGRRGVMEVTMVLDKEDVSAAVPQYRKLVGGLKFNSGETYSEYRQGDKLAEYGLVGLASGGIALAAVKWWKPLMKFGIFIVAGIALVLKKVFSMFRRSPAAG